MHVTRGQIKNLLWRNERLIRRNWQFLAPSRLEPNEISFHLQEWICMAICNIVELVAPNLSRQASLPAICIIANTQTRS